MACLCATVANSTASNGEAEYRLRLFHTHTGERLNIVYRRGNQYIPQALDQLVITCAIIGPAMCITTIPASTCCTI